MGFVVCVDPVTKRVTVNDKQVAKGQVEQWKLIIALQQVGKHIVEGQSRGASTQKLQAQGRALWQMFVQRHGYLNEPNASGKGWKNVPKLFADADDAWYLWGLETYDKETGVGKPSIWLTGDVIPRRAVVESTNSIGEAVVASIVQENGPGKVDPEYIGRLMGEKPEAVATELRAAGLAYYDPDDGWMLAAQFLSGDVVDRLERVSRDESLTVEKRVLTENQPDPVPVADMRISLGQSWVPQEHRQRYLRGITGMQFLFEYSQITGKWTIEVEQGGPRMSDSFMRRLATMPDLNMQRFWEALVNSAPITVRTGPPDNRVVDSNQTRAANQLISQINGGFTPWWASVNKDELIELYNRNMNRLKAPKWEAPESYRPPSLANGHAMRGFQSRSLWRFLVGGNMGLWHAAGSGKTLVLAAMAIEAKRLGLARRPIIVTKGSVKPQFLRQSRMFFPASRIISPDESTTMRAGVDAFLAQASGDADWDVAVLTYTQFAAMELSLQRQIDYLNQDIEDITEAMEMAGMINNQSDRRSEVEAIRVRLQKERDKIMKKASSWEGRVSFEAAGIDLVLLDEAHNMKNMRVVSDIPEANNAGAARTQDLMWKLRYMDEVNPRRNFVHATATPFTNKIGELWTAYMQIRRQQMIDNGHQHFDQWRRDYSQTIERLNQRTSGEFYMDPRLAYGNMPSLQREMWNIADIVTEEELEATVKIPEAEFHTIEASIPDDYWDRAYAWIIRRVNDMTHGGGAQLPSGKDDIFLTAYDDLNMISTDLRLVDDTLPEMPNGVLPKLARQVVDIYEKTADAKSTQLVMLEFDKRPLWGSRFVISQFLKQRMKKLGVDPNEIAVVNGDVSKDQREHIYNLVDEGKVRILLASRSIVGEGVNIQSKLRAIHWFAAPHRPSDLVQGNRRGIRFGNENDKVDIYMYALGGSGVARWAAVQRKARTLLGVVSNDPVTEHTLEDESDSIGADAMMRAILMTDSYDRLSEYDKRIADLSTRRLLLRQREANALETVKGADQRKRRLENDLERNQILSKAYEEWGDAPQSYKFLKARIVRRGRWNYTKGEFETDLIEEAEGEGKKTFDVAPVPKVNMDDFEADSLREWTIEHERREAELEIPDNWLTRYLAMFPANDIGLELTYELLGITLEVKIPDYNSRYAEKRSAGGSLYNHDLSGGLPAMVDSSGNVRSYKAAVGKLEDGDYFLRAEIKNADTNIERLSGELARHDGLVEEAQTFLDEGERWTAENEQEFETLLENRRALNNAIIQEGNDKMEQAMDRVANLPPAGQHFSTVTGVRQEAVQDTELRDEAERIVREIFPDVRGIHFSDVLIGSGPALARSQQAAGQEVTAMAEVAGKADRARAVVEISLGQQFDPLNTAHHEAYHLARMLLTDQERQILEDAYPDEEDEAMAFAERFSDDPRVITAWGRIIELFRRLGNLLRGRGFNSVDSIFNQVKLGAIGRREGQAMDAAEPLYSAKTDEAGDVRLGGTNVRMNEVEPEEAEEWAQMRKASGLDKYYNPKVPLDRIRAMAGQILYDKDKLAEIASKQATMPEGKLTSEIQVWRILHYKARRALFEAAKALQEDMGSQEKMVTFADAMRLRSDIWFKYDALASEIGRALNAFRMPISTLGGMEIADLDEKMRIIERGGELPKEKVGDVELDETDIKTAVDGVADDNRGEGFDDGSEPTPSGDPETDTENLRKLLIELRQDELDTLIAAWRDYPEELKKLLQLIVRSEERVAPANEEGAAAINKALYLFYNSILSSPTTQLRNFLGGVLMLYGLTPFEEAVEVALPIKGSLRADEFRAGLSGFQGDLEEASKAFFETITTGDVMDPMTFETSQNLVDARYVWGDNHILSRSFFRPEGERGIAEFMPTRVLFAADEFFKSMATRRHLRQQAMRVATNKRVKDREQFVKEYLERPPKSAYKHARRYARYITLTEPLTPVGRKLAQLRNSTLIGTLLLPILRTVWNMMRHGARRLPGLGLAAVHASTGGVSWTAKERWKAGGRNRARLVSEQVTGMAILLSSYYAVSRGLITGQGPSDDDERRAWMQVFQPYSIQVGGRWYRYDNWWDVLSIPIGTTVSTMEALGMGSVAGVPRDIAFMERTIQVASRAVTGMAKSLLNKTMLQNVRRALESASDEDRLPSFLRQMTTQPLPALLRWVARRTQDNLPAASNVGEQWKRSIPWAVNSVPPVRGIYGQPIKMESSGGVTIGRETRTPLTGPAGTEEDRRRRYATEFARLGMGVAKPPRRILGGVALESDEYDAYQVYRGNQLWAAHSTVMSSPNYWRLSDPLRRKVLKLAQAQFSMGEQGFAAHMAAQGNTRILNEWVNLERKFGRTSIPGWAYQYID